MSDGELDDAAEARVRRVLNEAPAWDGALLIVVLLVLSGVVVWLIR